MKRTWKSDFSGKVIKLTKFRGNTIARVSHKVISNKIECLLFYAWKCVSYGTFGINNICQHLSVFQIIYITPKIEIKWIQIWWTIWPMQCTRMAIWVLVGHNSDSSFTVNGVKNTVCSMRRGTVLHELIFIGLILSSITANIPFSVGYLRYRRLWNSQKKELGMN